MQINHRVRVYPARTPRRARTARLAAAAQDDDDAPLNAEELEWVRQVAAIHTA